MRPFVGHDELEMDRKNFQRKPVVVLGLMHFPEPDRQMVGLRLRRQHRMPWPADRIERKEDSSHPCATWQSIQSIEGSIASRRS